MTEMDPPNRSSFVARNSDLAGVASLLLVLVSPLVCALGWIVAKNGAFEAFGAVLYLGSLALAIVVISVGRRGRGAAIASLVTSIPIGLVYLGTLVLRLMIE